MYGRKVGRETDQPRHRRVMEDGRWGNGRLEQIYPILYLDALVIKIRDGQAVRSFACYLAIGVNLEGDRDVLGMWFQETEGAKFWMQVLTDLKQRGVQRHADLLRRRADRVPRGDRGDLPQDDRADVHRPPDPQQPQVRAPQASASRSPATSSRSTPPRTPTRPTPSSRPSIEKWGARFPMITQAG